MTDDAPRQGSHGQIFSTTNWSLIVAAGDLQQPEARQALAALCETYWYPVYALIRHHGHAPDRAEDLAQGFFVELLERESFKAAERDRGTFRAFLRTLLRHYLSNEHRRATAHKRGGSERFLQMDLSEAEARYRTEEPSSLDPEAAFERRWARAVLARGLDRLREELRDSPDAERWRQLEPLLTGDPGALKYREIADALGLSESAVKVAVHRLRKRYGQALRDEVAQTVADPKRVDEEVRYLIQVVGN